jgi:hypothetical protein
MESMEARFGRQMPVEAQKAAVRNLRQQETETLRQFADRVREVAIEACPGFPDAQAKGSVCRHFCGAYTRKMLHSSV